MPIKEYDWKAIQQYYDAGNSWRAVAAEFGIFNKSIQRAVKRGDLVSRDRSKAAVIRYHSLSQKFGRKVKFKKVSNCIDCNTTFSYSPHSQSGQFCSLECFNRHRWKTDTVARIIIGDAFQTTVKKYLLMHDPFCKICRVDSWMGKPISLQIDHIDGDSDNNRLDNTRLLCPNCHSQTDTFGSKNKGRFKSVRNLKRTPPKN